MANKTKEFTLAQDLEALLGNCNSTSKALELARKNPSVDDVETRENLYEAFNDPRYLSMAPATLVGDLGAVRKEKYHALDEKLDEETYNKGLEFYKTELSPEITAMMYGNLITKEGILPKEASKELKEVVARLQIAELIEKALSKGDVRQAVKMADQLMGDNQKARMIYNDANAGAAFERFKETIVADVAKSQKAQAYGILAQGKLYAEIDKAIGETEYGKAKSFTAAYNAYGTQQQINKAKAEAEAEAKKLKAAA